MWSNIKKKDKKKQMVSKRLSEEIFRIFGFTFLLAVVCFWVLNEMANRIVLRYYENSMLMISEYQLIDLQYWILGISMIAGIVLFIVLFLFLVGERLAYIHEIVKGIDALGRHEWDYEIPLKGENELTALAKRVNELSEEEQAFQEKERKMQEEKESLIRSLSHDIRTPLTSMMSYSEFMKQKDVLTEEEIKAYMELVEQKSQQIKVLTDRLLEGGNRQVEYIENGKFLMEQLADEWACELEESFKLEVSLEDCPEFSGEFDIQELRRVFDNLSSNIGKYADEDFPVILRVMEKEDRVCICQSNKCKNLTMPVESTKIGIESIRRIVEHYGGSVTVLQSDGDFSIEILLAEA